MHEHIISCISISAHGTFRVSFPTPQINGQKFTTVGGRRLRQHVSANVIITLITHISFSCLSLFLRSSCFPRTDMSSLRGLDLSSRRRPIAARSRYRRSEFLIASRNHASRLVYVYVRDLIGHTVQFNGNFCRHLTRYRRRRAP